MQREQEEQKEKDVIKEVITMGAPRPTGSRHTWLLAQLAKPQELLGERTFYELKALELDTIESVGSGTVGEGLVNNAVRYKSFCAGSWLGCRTKSRT